MLDYKPGSAINVYYLKERRQSVNDHYNSEEYAVNNLLRHFSTEGINFAMPKMENRIAWYAPFGCKAKSWYTEFDIRHFTTYPTSKHDQTRVCRCINTMRDHLHCYRSRNERDGSAHCMCRRSARPLYCAVMHPQRTANGKHVPSLMEASKCPAQLTFSLFSS